VADLTAEQLAALAPLTSKRRAFVVALVGEACGNQTEAARLAGYKSPAVEGCRLLKNANVLEAVTIFRNRATTEAIADGDEVLAFLTAVMRDEEPDVYIDRVSGEQQEGSAALADRIRAAQTLAKVHGLETNRHEVLSMNVAQVQIVDTREAVRRAAKGDK
jgi:phage terminase small subunit